MTDRDEALHKHRYTRALSLRDDEVELFMPRRAILGSRLFVRNKGSNPDFDHQRPEMTPTEHKWGLGLVTYLNGSMQHGMDTIPADVTILGSEGSWHDPPEKPIRETWSPAGYEADWQATDELLLSEEISLRNDVIVNTMRFTNTGHGTRKVALTITGTIIQRGNVGPNDRLWNVNWKRETQVLRAQEDRVAEKRRHPEAAVNSTMILAVQGDFAVRNPLYAASRELLDQGEGRPAFGASVPGPKSEWAYRLTATADISPGTSNKLILLYTRYPAAKTAMAAMRVALRDPANILREAEKDWDRYLSKAVPAFDSDDGNYVKLYYWNWYADRANRVEFIDYPTIRKPIVADDKLRYTNFQATGCYARRLQIERWLHTNACSGGLDALLSSQRADGNCGIPVDDPGAEGGMFTEMPLLTAAVWAHYETTWDKTFLRSALPVLVEYDDFFRNHRDKDGDGLIEVLGMGEIGTYDDSPRCYEMGAEGWFDWDFDNQPAEPVDVNSVIYLQRKLIARMAGVLGETELQRQFEASAELLKQKMDEYMWDDERKLYCDVYGSAHTKVQAKTPAIFAPLRAGLAGAGRGTRVIKDHMLNPKEFWDNKPVPIPSLSYDDKDYSPDVLPACKSRGEVSGDLVWDAITALANYGEEARAAELTDLMVKMMVKGGIPTSGERYAPNGRPIGGYLYGWSNLINDTIITRILGIMPDPIAGSVSFSPRLPTTMNHFALNDVRIGGGRLSFSCDRRAGKITLAVTNVGGKAMRVNVGGRDLVLRKGERADTTGADSRI